MKIQRTAPLAFLALLAFQPVLPELRFAPPEGESVYKSFQVEAAFALEDLSMRMNDEEFPFEASGMDPSDVEGEASYELVVRDLFESFSDGRPTKITRSYETALGSWDMPDEAGEDSMDEIEGETVVFTWNEEDADYDRAWADEDGDQDDDVLATLASDLDLLALLPPDGVEEGDTWEVPARALGSLLFPGVDLGRASKADVEGWAGVPTEMAEPLQEALDDAVMQCTFKGLRAGDGGDLALVELVLETDLSIDIADSITERLASEAEFEGSVDAFTVDLYLDFSGELLWDLKRGHFHALELSGDVALDVYADAEIDLGEVQFPVEFEAELTGEISIEGTTVE